MKSLLLVCLIGALHSQSIASLMSTLKDKNANPPGTGGTVNSTIPVFNSTQSNYGVYTINQSYSNSSQTNVTSQQKVSQNATAPKPQYQNTTSQTQGTAKNSTIKPKPQIVDDNQVNQTNSTYQNNTRPKPNTYSNVTNQTANSSAYQNSTYTSNTTYYNSTQNVTYQNSTTTIKPKPQKVNSTSYNQPTNTTYQNTQNPNVSNLSNITYYNSTTNTTQYQNSTYSNTTTIKPKPQKINSTSYNQASNTTYQNSTYTTMSNSSQNSSSYQNATYANSTNTKNATTSARKTNSRVNSTNQLQTYNMTNNSTAVSYSNTTLNDSFEYLYYDPSNQTYTNQSAPSTSNSSYATQTHIVYNVTQAPRADNSTYKKKLRKIATGQWNILEQNEFLFRNTNIVGEALVAIKQIHETREDGFEFLEVVSVAEQVVAGINYDIKMRFANQEGETRLFNVLIYTAPWTRQPDQIVSCEEIIDPE